MEEGRFYHIYNRGNNRENIFHEEENYFYFLKKYNQYLSNYVDTYTYCLMPNHFHFLVRIKEYTKMAELMKTSEVLKTSEVYSSFKLTPVEKAFRDFFISYAKSINKKYNRTGSLFQSKFKRKIIDDEKYLKQLVLYIHLNPVIAGFCNNISDWQFSSYNAIIRRDQANLNRNVVLEWFADTHNFVCCHQMKFDVETIKKYVLE